MLLGNVPWLHEPDLCAGATVVRGLHTAESLTAAAEWIRGAKEYYLQQYRDSGAILDAEGLGAFDADEMHALADAVRPIVPSVQVRGV